MKLMKINLKHPLKDEELNGYDSLRVTLALSLCDLVNCDCMEGLNELVEEEILGVESSFVLGNLGYKVIGHTLEENENDNKIVLEVEAELHNLRNYQDD